MDYTTETMGAENNAPKKRPNFITVLCILTWVGCGLAILGSIMGYFSTKIQCATMGSISDAYGPMQGMVEEVMDSACKNLVPNTIIAIVCGLICLVGSLLMWQLKKTGFFIYAVGELVPVVTSFILGAGGMLGTIGVVFGAIVAIAWVVMYGVNLKHMH